MKKFLLLFSLCVLGFTAVKAQIPDGSIAPDFTATDLDGNSHTLYELLDAGKVVFLDMSATWCGPCWNYHNSHAFETIWEEYGPNGTDEAYVMFIEGDPSTNTACLYGPTGCIGGTQGDWVDGTPYPIIESSSIANSYQINYYPTIFCVCPADKKVYEAGQLSAAGLWNFQATHCIIPSVAITTNSVQNVKCYGTNSGGINISVLGGTAPHTYIWSNGATTQDLINVAAGDYSVTVTSNNGWTGVSDPITVEGPSSALVVTATEINPVGCNGILGNITVEGSGGWTDNYDYNWQNGQVGPTAFSLNIGNHLVSVTDAGGCIKTLSTYLAPPVYPIASIATPSLVTCAQPNIQLNATASSSGPDFSYQWFASNGGNIVSGGTTTTPTVNAAGTYTIQVTNIVNNCITFATTPVSADLVQPTANAGPVQTVSCTLPTATLQGSGSSGSNFVYLWTASNGGNIVSGANTLNPVVNAAGTYTLKVTNSSNGCTQTSATSVTGNNTPPTLTTSNGVITCVTSAVTLTTTTNANNPSFVWTGPNGYNSTLQSPTVNVSGSYNVVVTDPGTGCTNTAAASVTTNTNVPGATATGATLTCVINSVTITASTPDSNATFAWTGPNGFGSSQQNPTVNLAGAYNLIVTDPDNGCTSTATATVALNDIAPTASATTPGNLNCNTTQLQLNGTGSSQGANFTYAWTTTNGNIVSGANTQTPIVDAAGSYSILVTNADNGCTSTASTNVVQSQVVSASIFSQTNISCNGGSNGAATVSAGGGNGNFTYAWSNGATTANISNVPAGVYLATVTDGENCTASITVTITQPDVLAANATATPQTANNVNDGTATANPAGGTAAYTYVWSNNATTQTITGLAPGSYTVSVTDANGCTSVQTVTVNSFNCALSANIAGTNVTCFAANNGTATVNLTGAADPVTYAWSNGATTQSVSNLVPGFYSVNVTDGNNCPASLSISISEPTQLLPNATSTNETAAGANDGTATANPTGGTGNYTYSWSNGATTQSITGLAPATYTVVVTDANGCTSSQTIVVNSFACASSVQASVTNVTCAGAANGSVTVSLTGGTAPFTYLWSNGGTTATISNLTGGTYTVSITDANQCQLVSSSSVSEPAPYSPWTVQTTSPLCPNDATGSATASISGGTLPYTFLWSNGATSNTISNVTAGTYTVAVTDANGCQSSISVVITALDNLPPTISLQNAIATLDANGSVEITLAMLSAQIADNCGVANTAISPSSFNCTNIGQQQVTVTVTDQSGLTATATATVTVVDNIAPVLICPSNILACSYDNTVDYDAPVAQDNCLTVGGGHWTQISGLPSGSEFPIGNTTQTYTYTDASGNLGSCSFDVTVTSPVLLNNIAITNDVNNQGVGAIDITVSGGSTPYSYTWVKNGQILGTTEDLNSLTAGSYTVTIKDDNGCLYATENIVVENTVATKEPTWLSGVKLQPNPTSGLTRVVFAQEIAASLEISVIDATGRVLLTNISEQQSVISLDCSNLPGGMYALRFRTGQEVGVRKLMVNR